MCLSSKRLAAAAMALRSKAICSTKFFCQGAPKAPHIQDYLVIIKGKIATVTLRNLCRAHFCAAALAFLFAALARFFCLGFGLVLPAVPRDIFPRFER